MLFPLDNHAMTTNDKNTRLRVALFDLWHGLGHAYYTGPLCEALCRREDLTVGLFYNQKQDLSLYGNPAARFAVDAPTGLDRSQWGRLATQPLGLAKMLANLRRFNPDVIHLSFCHPWLTMLLPVLGRWRPVISTLHDVTPHHGEETLRNHLANRTMICVSRRVFVHGPELLRMAEERYPTARGRFASIPMGHLEILSQYADFSLEPEPATFLIFGRLLPYKGLRIALEALEIVAAEEPDARLIIAGRGDLAKEASLIERLRGRVELHHRFISNAELGELMGRSLAVLLPYTHASGSGVVATASAFERCVIASRLGGLIDMIVDGKTGRLFKPGSVHELASLMIQAIRNRSETLEMGRAARRHARDQGSWDRIAEILCQSYYEEKKRS
jgi:glycosyltransferase involved in cell wall biosynthesis